MKHRACKVCGEPSGLQSYCSAEHYTFWKEHHADIVERVCSCGCGRTFREKLFGTRVYYSDACRWKTKRQREAERHKVACSAGCGRMVSRKPGDDTPCVECKGKAAAAAVSERTCPVCGETFTVNSRTRRKVYCSPECYTRDKGRMTRKTPACGAGCWWYTTCAVRVWSPDFILPCWPGSRYHADYIKRYPAAEVTT